MSTKNKVKQFIRQQGCKASYSGKNRTMYIKGATAEKAELAELAVLKTFKNLAFSTETEKGDV